MISVIRNDREILTDITCTIPPDRFKKAWRTIIAIVDSVLEIGFETLEAMLHWYRLEVFIKSTSQRFQSYFQFLMD